MSAQPILSQTDSLVGTDMGLFRISGTNSVPLWTDGGIYKIIRTRKTPVSGILIPDWYFLTSKGIFSSSDLSFFRPHNDGLPVSVIKEYDGSTKTFVRETQLLKDLKVHPEDPSILVTAAKDAVFLSKDAGNTWKHLGTSAATAGVKSVAAAYLPVTAADGTEKKELVVFMSHPIYGISWCYADRDKPRWTDITDGFELQETTSFVDEIADILPVVRTDGSGNTRTEIYLTQTFRPRLYRLDWEAQKGVLLWKGPEPADTADSLQYTGTSLAYVAPGAFGEYVLSGSGNAVAAPAGVSEPYQAGMWKRTIRTAPGVPQWVWLPASQTGGRGPLSFSELWLLNPDTIYNDRVSVTAGRKGLYIPVGKVSTEKGLNEYIDTITKNGLNAAVIDMKDDFGNLQYDAKAPLVVQKGYISRNKVNLDEFTAKMKEAGVYLIARIVVFKDKNLARYGGGKYAVWDRKEDAPWTGIRGYTEIKDEEGNVTETEAEYYDENWVDPYSEEVWEYNIAVAKELIERGFDEIQFDYIRFPTDGYNLADASYRWRDPGMDKESALMSFLSYARKNIDAPISIDIYGANGWYRTGARTGQDVELLAKYADVISPMFYPSHFEQTFLAHDPPEERPYRIYFYGGYRNAVIGRNRVLIRPWAQAFYLNVSYDRAYYDENYVEKQIFGARDSTDGGYLYWNNSGRYGDIRPDPEPGAPYTGSAFEADTKFRKPAL